MLTMTKGNRIEFELDQPDIVLRGMADESQGTIFSGRLVVHLCEPIRVKGLKMVLEGHELLQWEYHNDGAISSFYRETTPLSHTWTFFTTANGKKVETWDAGRHEFPFSLIFPGSLPETIKIPYANVAYFLKATLRRTGIMHNISAKREVTVKRDLTMDGGIGSGAVDVENRWHEMMDFSITSDADTFTPGDKLRARFTFQPLVKHLHLDKIGVVLKEYVRCHAPSGHAEKTVSRVAAHAEVIPNPESAIMEFSECSDLIHAAKAAATPQNSSGASTPLSLSKSFGKRPEHHGVDLITALEEHINMTIPTTDRRLQYDHISSYIEITHKLKFSISFHDPEDKPHTLWVSVPVSIVPTIIDEVHHAGPELPSYAKAALDQRVVVAGIEPNPPTYDSVITESLSHAASPAYSPASPGLSTSDDQSLNSEERAVSSSMTSVHSRDETEMLDVSTMGTSAAAAQNAMDVTQQDLHRDASTGLLQPELVRISRTRLSVDASRPPVHPSAVHNFLRRPVVFPASAEATPLATPLVTPAATPMSSPMLKNSEDPIPAPHNVHSVLASTSSSASRR